MDKNIDLLQFIDMHKPYIIIGAETWLSQDVSNNELIPSDLNYNIKSLEVATNS